MPGRLIIGISLLVAAAIGLAAAQKDRYTHPPAAEIESRELVELSGIVRAEGGGEFWGHNDSGHPAALFRFNDRGEMLQRVVVSGADSVDWEGMTADAHGALYVGDFGDNGRRRSDCTIYKLAPPAPEAKDAAPLASRRFAYPDDKPRDCEAIFVMNGHLYLISKEQSPLRQPTVFCVDSFNATRTRAEQDGDATSDDADSGKGAILREVGRMQLTGFVTDAAYSSARKELAVLTYSGVIFLAVAEESDLLKPPTNAIGGYFGQCEALCYDGDEIIITNEPGAIWRFAAPER